MYDRKKHIAELEKTADFLRKEIETARKDLEGEPLSIEYDHGGGQSGQKENPAFTAFAKMLKSYQAVITQLEGLKKPDESEKVVSLVKGSKWKRA